MYGVTNLYWRDKRMISSMEAASSPSRSIFSSNASTRARAQSLGSCGCSADSLGKFALEDMDTGVPSLTPCTLKPTSCAGF